MWFTCQSFSSIKLSAICTYVQSTPRCKLKTHLFPVSFPDIWLTPHIVQCLWWACICLLKFSAGYIRTFKENLQDCSTETIRLAVWTWYRSVTHMQTGGQTETKSLLTSTVTNKFGRGVINLTKRYAGILGFAQPFRLNNYAKIN